MKVMRGLLMSMALVMSVVSANKGPDTEVALITKGSNDRRSKLELKFWVYTDGKGGAYINFTNNLEIEEAVEGSTLMFATVV